ncbi:hypothetical protein GCM10009647_050380 [Streptomyces sanglieri]
MTLTRPAASDSAKYTAARSTATKIPPRTTTMTSSIRSARMPALSPTLQSGPTPGAPHVHRMCTAPRVIDERAPLFGSRGTRAGRYEIARPIRYTAGAAAVSGSATPAVMWTKRDG